MGDPVDNEVRYFCRKCWGATPRSFTKVSPPSASAVKAGILCNKGHSQAESPVRAVYLKLKKWKWVEVREPPKIPVPANGYEYCVSLKHKNKCTTGPKCTFAHSEAERIHWTKSAQASGRFPRGADDGNWNGEDDDENFDPSMVPRIVGGRHSRSVSVNSQPPGVSDNYHSRRGSNNGPDNDDMGLGDDLEGPLDPLDTPKRPEFTDDDFPGLSTSASGSLASRATSAPIAIPSGPLGPSPLISQFSAPSSAPAVGTIGSSLTTNTASVSLTTTSTLGTNTRQSPLLQGLPSAAYPPMTLLDESAPYFTTTLASLFTTSTSVSTTTRATDSTAPGPGYFSTAPTLSSSFQQRWPDSFGLSTGPTIAPPPSTGATGRTPTPAFYQSFPVTVSARFLHCSDGRKSHWDAEVPSDTTGQALKDFIIEAHLKQSVGTPHAGSLRDSLLLSCIVPSTRARRVLHDQDKLSDLIVSPLGIDSPPMAIEVLIVPSNARTLSVYESLVEARQLPEQLEALATLAVPEYWGETGLPFLRQHFLQCFARCEETGQLLHCSEDGFVFNTGLWASESSDSTTSRAPFPLGSSTVEEIYAVFERAAPSTPSTATPSALLTNALSNQQTEAPVLVPEWRLTSFRRRSEAVLFINPLPEPARFFPEKRQTELHFDSDHEVRVEIHHLLRDASSRERLSKALGGQVAEKYWDMLVLGSVADLQSKLHHRPRPRIAAPVWVDDHPQFLLPLRLSREDAGCTLLLAVEAAVTPYYGVTDYRAVSILAQDEGYTRTRLIDTPEADWMSEVFGPRAIGGLGTSTPLTGTTNPSPASSTSSSSASGPGPLRPRTGSGASLMLNPASPVGFSPSGGSNLSRYFEDIVHLDPSN